MSVIFESAMSGVRGVSEEAKDWRQPRRAKRDMMGGSCSAKGCDRWGGKERGREGPVKGRGLWDVCPFGLLGIADDLDDAVC